MHATPLAFAALQIMCPRGKGIILPESASQKLGRERTSVSAAPDDQTSAPPHQIVPLAPIYAQIRVVKPTPANSWRLSPMEFRPIFRTPLQRVSNTPPVIPSASPTHRCAHALQVSRCSNVCALHPWAHVGILLGMSRQRFLSFGAAAGGGRAARCVLAVSSSLLKLCGATESERGPPEQSA